MVERRALPVHLAGGEDLLRLGDPARVHHVDAEVVDQLVLDQRLELPLVRELLAGRDRQVDLVAHQPQRERVERPDRVLVEVEAIGLERVPEVGRLGRAEHRVRVEEQVDVVADREPQRLRRLDRLHDRRLRIPVRQRVLVERGERAVAERRESLLEEPVRILDQLLRGVAGEMPVDAHPLARRAAEEVVDRDAEPLPLEIPERDVDPGDRAHDHLPGRPERAAHHLAPPVLDLRRVLPDEQVAEVVEDPEHAPPAPAEARLADARSAPRRCGRAR